MLDTRTTHAQAREILDDLRELGSPRVGIVVNSHGHYDHAFGNPVFRPAPIWGHERCAAMLPAFGERMREGGPEVPDIRDDLAEVVIDPPDRLFFEQASICLDDGREVSLATPRPRPHRQRRRPARRRRGRPVRGRSRGERRDALLRRRLPDGLARHDRGAARAGRPVDGRRPGARRPRRSRVRRIAARGLPRGRRRARRVHAGEATVDDVLPLVPYPADEAREPVERAVAQLRGELEAASRPSPRPGRPGPPSGRAPGRRRWRPARARGCRGRPR